MCELSHEHETADNAPRGITQLVDELVVAITNIRVYAPTHPRVASALDQLLATLGAQPPDDAGEILLGCADGYLFHDRRPLLGASLSAGRVLEPLTALGAGGLVFERGVTREDVVPVIELLAAPRRWEEGWRQANEALERSGVRRIRLIAPFQAANGRAGPAGGDEGDARAGRGLPAPPPSEDEVPPGMHVELPAALYHDVVDALQDVMVRSCRGDSLDLAAQQTQVESILRRLRDDPQSMMRIARYEQYDAFTFGHSIRVAFLALGFTQALTDDEELLQRVGLAALLHDVGKARIPYEILFARGRLDAEQRHEMSKHAAYGAEILLEAANHDPLVVAAVFGHHKTLDDGGYPSTLHRSRLSLTTRITKICDVFEALTAVRPYKPRMSPLRAYRIMMAMDDHFDRALLRRFIAVTGLYPVGHRVRLSTGEEGRVLAQTEDLRRPVIRIDRDAEGQAVPPDEQRVFDARVGGAAPEDAEVAELLVEAEL